VVVLAALLALLVAPLFMGWLVVDVRTPAPDRVDLKIPVPLGLIRLGLALAPDRAMTVEAPAELRRQKDVALAVLRALDESPDGTTFVRVTSPDAKVRIAKEGGRLIVDVDADDARVRFKLRAAALQRALEPWDWQQLTPDLALNVLAAVGPGELVAVDADDARVRISVF
jgi:multidrug efflux pump subunit AcrA (membrane-fusion protein)